MDIDTTVADDVGWAIRHSVTGPLPAEAADAHSRARKLAARLGGDAEVLRSSDAGWTVVATYTDQGARIEVAA